MEPKKYNKLMKVSGNKTGIALTVMFLFCAAGTVNILISYLSSNNDLKLSDIIRNIVGLGIIAIALIAFALYFLSTALSNLTICDDGVLLTNLFTKRFMKWEDVADFGILANTAPGRGSSFRSSYLYFSDGVIPHRGEKAKQKPKNFIRIAIRSSDMHRVLHLILPCAKSATGFGPYIPRSVANGNW